MQITAHSAPAKVIQEQVLWMRVGALFQDGAAECVDCTHCKTLCNRHPYGNTTATEYLSECDLGSRIGDRPEQCPALQAQGEEA